MRMRDLGLLSRFHGNQTIVRLFENKFGIITSKSPTEKQPAANQTCLPPYTKRRRLQNKEREISESTALQHCKTSHMNVFFFLI
jgi:hypothetical protein